MVKKNGEKSRWVSSKYTNIQKQTAKIIPKWIKTLETTQKKEKKRSKNTQENKHENEGSSQK